MATFDTKEQRLALVIALVDMPTSGTLARAIARINIHGWHTGPLSFVFNKASQLCKCPSAMLRSIFAPNRGLFPDALKILKADQRLLCLRFINELIRYAMVL